MRELQVLSILTVMMQLENQAGKEESKTTSPQIWMSWT
jgi:hypothetical protein